MAFFRWLGFESVDLKFSTERLGVSIFCSLFTIAATFTPVINTPHISVQDIPNDMSHSRLLILLLEIVGIALALVGLRLWAAGLLLFTFYELFLNLRYSVLIIESINAGWAEDPKVHFKELSTLSWGWWFILLGPCIMAGVLIRDFIRRGR